MLTPLESPPLVLLLCGQDGTSQCCLYIRVLKPETGVLELGDGRDYPPTRAVDGCHVDIVHTNTEVYGILHDLMGNNTGKGAIIALALWEEAS